MRNIFFIETLSQYMDVNLFLVIYFLLGGMLAGLLGGLLGLGGGIIVVPLLHYVFVTQEFTPSSLMQVAVATSLATIVVTSISATWMHHRRQAVIWKIVLYLAPGIMLGAVLGAVLADNLKSDVLRIIFGLFEILVAIQIAFDLTPKAKVNLPDNAGLIASGGVIGAISTLLGIGGGTLTVPFLNFCRVPMHNAVAISSACGIPIAVAGSISMLLSGLDNPDLPAHSIGYVYWPAAIIIMTMTVLFAPLGAKLAHKLSVKVLKRCFSVVLLIVGIQMLLSN